METHQLYTNSNPRRSHRARSLVNRFSPGHYPRLNIEKNPENSQTEPKKSRTRSINSNGASEEPAEASLQPYNLFYEEMRQGMGQIRIPLVSEVRQMAEVMVKMRYIEIDFIALMIRKMKEQNVEDQVVKAIENDLNHLRREISPNTVKEDDLPPLGTNNYVDISTFLIMFFEKIHENMHRILDLEYCLHMLSHEQLRQLKQYSKEAAKLFFVHWKKLVNELKMPEFSRRKYQRVRDEIIRSCESCSPNEGY